MAEIIFTNLCRKNKRTDIVAESAGTHAEIGTPMSIDAQIALRDCKERLPKVPHTARQWTADMFSQYDHIICLTNAHKFAVCGFGGGPAPVNVRSLDDWVHCGDIADPWQHGADKYYEVCQKLQFALKLLFKELIK
jgi:protein-tyrosine-phosphatase